jgi:hypothetical protein
MLALDMLFQPDIRVERSVASSALHSTENLHIVLTTHFLSGEAGGRGRFRLLAGCAMVTITTAAVTIPTVALGKHLARLSHTAGRDEWNMISSPLEHTSDPWEGIWSMPLKRIIRMFQRQYKSVCGFRIGGSPEYSWHSISCLCVREGREEEEQEEEEEEGGGVLSALPGTEDTMLPTGMGIFIASCQLMIEMILEDWEPCGTDRQGKKEMRRPHETIEQEEQTREEGLRDDRGMTGRISRSSLDMLIGCLSSHNQILQRGWQHLGISFDLLPALSAST